MCKPTEWSPSDDIPRRGSRPPKVNTYPYGTAITSEESFRDRVPASCREWMVVQISWGAGIPSRWLDLVESGCGGNLGGLGIPTGVR
jgi:hypothetical protein